MSNSSRIIARITDGLSRHGALQLRGFSSAFHDGASATSATAAPTVSGRSSRMQRWVASLVSGVLLGLSFPPFPFPLLAWIALVPLLLVWMGHESGRSAFVDAYVAFVATFAVAFQWPLFHEMAATAWLSLPGLLVLPMWMAVPFGLAVIFRRRLGMLPSALLLVALFLLMEAGMRRGPLAFPWSLLGHTQAEVGPLNGLAAWGGVPLLTLAVLTANVCIAGLARSFLTDRTTALCSGLATVVALLVPWLMLQADILLDVRHPTDSFRATEIHQPFQTTGALKSPRTHAADGSPEIPGPSETAAAPEPIGALETTVNLKMAIVQPGLSAEAWSDLNDASRVDTLLALSAGVPRSVDLVLWPETALPPNAAERANVARWADSSGLSVLTGAILERQGRRSYYNAALLFQPNHAVQIYRKERLVPFAEQVPFQERLPWLRYLAVPSGGVRGYASGRENTLLEIPDGRLGVAICFESLFDDALRSSARRGATVLVVLTQDGWWGDSHGYRQHLAFNRLRAIENGLPLVQVSVSGLSGVVAPGGRVGHRIGWMERDVRVVQIPQRRGATPYVRFGDWVTLLAAAWCLAGLVSLLYLKYT